MASHCLSQKIQAVVLQPGALGVPPCPPLRKCKALAYLLLSEKGDTHATVHVASLNVACYM